MAAKDRQKKIKKLKKKLLGACAHKNNDRRPQLPRAAVVSENEGPVPTGIEKT
jgi:hypothetical protein